jgi:hypothetical protein
VLKKYHNALQLLAPKLWPPPEREQLEAKFIGYHVVDEEILSLRYKRVVSQDGGRAQLGIVKSKFNGDKR